MLPLNGIAHDDVNQWLNRGWFVHRGEDGSITPILYHGMEGTHLTGIDVQGRMHSHPKLQCFAHWPRCGAVNLPLFALYAERIPQRQYRRTYNSRCIELVIPRKWELMKLHGPMVSSLTSDSGSVIEAVFNPQYPTFEDACEQVRGGVFSRAINPYMVLTMADTGRLLVYHRGDCVGWIEGNKFVPSVQSPQMSRRLNKMFNGRITTCELAH